MAVTLITAATNPADQAFVELITNTSVFARVLHFIPTPGLAYDYGEVAALGGIYYRGINEIYPEGEYSVVNPKSERLSVFGGEVRTDNRLINGEQNARANEIGRRIKRAGLFYDAEVMNGEGFGDQKAIVGLKHRLGGRQVLDAGVNGDLLTLPMVDELLDRVHGKHEEKVLLMNKAARRKLKQLVVASAGGAAITDVGGSLAKYDGATIEILDEDGDEVPIIGIEEAMGTSNATTSIYCIRPGSSTDRESFQGLIQRVSGDADRGAADVRRELNSQLVQVRGGVDFGEYTRDVVETALGISLFHPRAAARLRGVKVA